LKTILYTIIMLVLPSCGAITKKNEKKLASAEGSLRYYPATPTKLDEKEFSRYHAYLKEYFGNTLLSSNFNGGILIAKDGAVLYEDYKGRPDLRQDAQMNENSPLHIASLSKTFTAMAVMRLHETGRLSIDDTLGKFFPAFPYPTITIKMLLSHRSSLPNYLNYLSELKVNDTCYSNQDVLNSLYTIKPNTEGRPGTRFSYSNTNYVLLALIIEKVTGETYPNYMKRVLFEPLQMKSTYVYNSYAPSFDGYGRYWSADPFDCTYGDKNIYSTPQDLLKWDQALYSGQLFSKETLEMAFTPLSNERPSVHNYGLGWRMLNLRNGKKVIYHNGRWHGSNAVFVRLMDEKATIIVVGNRFNRNIYTSARKAYDIFGNYMQDKPGNRLMLEEDNDEEMTVVKEKMLIDALAQGNPLKPATK
jgi:CubicO group peptidase (beta-lactamase class C family)